MPYYHIPWFVEVLTQHSKISLEIYVSLIFGKKNCQLPFKVKHSDNISLKVLFKDGAVNEELHHEVLPFCRINLRSRNILSFSRSHATGNAAVKLQIRKKSEQQVWRAEHCLKTQKIRPILWVKDSAAPSLPSLLKSASCRNAPNMRPLWVPSRHFLQGREVLGSQGYGLE